MSINHPKQRQIRLPFSVPRPSRSEAPKKICGICRQRDSQYTCPRCNVAYCSLDCFRAESHVQCSEPFYKDTVVSSIATDPKVDTEEKRRMIDMLRRFEEAQVEGDGAGGLDDDDEEDALAAALDGVDLDHIDSNALFHLLPQDHRDAFLAALRDPESHETKALVQIAAEERSVADLPDVLPWWEAEGVATDGPVGYAPPPRPVSQEVVGAIRPAEGTGVRLAYNAIAICIAYFHVLLSWRIPSLDAAYLAQEWITPEEIKSDFATLLPFLTEPKSTVRYESLREAWEAIWESIGKALPTPPTTDLLIRLLDLLPPLLRPSIVADELPKIALVISDMYHLFASPKAGTAGARKLAFYLAALRGVSRNEWLRLKSEVEKEIGKLRSEVDGAVEDEPDHPALKI